MESISESGRTIIFVSHNMASIEALCTKAIYIDNGKFELMGNTSKVILKYLSSSRTSIQHDLKNRKSRKGNGFVKIESAQLVNSSFEPLKFIRTGEDLNLLITFSKPIKRITSNRFCMSISNGKGERITTICSNLINHLHNFNDGEILIVIIP